jgi:hypothetical protein
MFLMLMVVGLVGLLVMALPALGRHHHGAGHLGDGGHHALHAGHHTLHAGHHALHAGHHALHAGHAAKLGAATQSGTAQPVQALTHPGQTANAIEATAGLTRFVPSPRLVFSLLALYGAFGNALVRAAHLTPLWAAILALPPAAALEKFAVTPLWNWLFRFEGQPSSPLEELILCDATAVTPFRNGRGIVSLVRDGRLVQFSARLVEQQADRAVRVGDRLRVEDLDARRERLTVAVPED